MPRSAEERQAALAALPPTIHLTFRQQAFTPWGPAYWYAEWVEKATGKHRWLYLGKEPPEHPCFGGQCTHPYRHHQPKRQPAGRGGPPIGYQPSEAAIERMRQAHLGKRRSVPNAPQHAADDEKNLLLP